MAFNFMVSPGSILKEYMDEHNLSQKDLATKTESSERHISNLVNGKVKLTEEFALKLESVFEGVKAEFWMDLEVAYRLYQLRTDGVDIDELSDISKKYEFKHLYKGMGLSLKEQAYRTLNILGVDNFHEVDSLRNNLHYNFMEDGGSEEAKLLWIKLAELEIEIQNDLEDLPLFNYDEFVKKYKNFKKLLFTKDIDQAIFNIRRYANSLGILFVYIESIPNAKIRGAVRMYNGRPLILLSDRYKKSDRIYFTFIHELMHVKNKDISEDRYEVTVDLESDVEELANQDAKTFLVEDEAYKEFILKGIFSEEEIIIFSNKHKVIPGMVVSFLQHDKLINYGVMNYLK